jgi:MarR family transcriptional regulator, organic hydroperoxide resistance regulator
VVERSPHPKMTIPELDGVDELSARVFRAVLGTAKLHVHLMMRMLAANGTHPGQAMCLRVLAVNDGAAQRDLADMLHVARPTITKMLQSMEKSGLVERRADEADQRLTRVYLTGAGRAAEKEMSVVAAEYVNATIATLPEDDRRELARLLDELGACITAASEKQQEARA